MILLPQTNSSAAGKVAESIRQALSRHPFEVAGTVSASFGVTEFSQADDMAGVLKRVDEALYLAKARGRNRVENASRVPHFSPKAVTESLSIVTENCSMPTR
jgi:diguanylate cyclase (GGDEF)-like protein